MFCVQPSLVWSVCRNSKNKRFANGAQPAPFQDKALQEPAKKHLYYLKTQKEAYSMNQLNRLPEYQGINLNDIYSMERALEKSDQETAFDSKLSTKD
jgi:hypothetical protein